MTKKDYELIAKAIYETSKRGLANADSVETVIDSISNVHFWLYFFYMEKLCVALYNGHNHYITNIKYIYINQEHCLYD